MRTIFSVWFGITLLVSGGAAVAAEAKADAVIPLRRELPVVDGAGDDACWTLLPWQEGAFTMLATTEKAPVQTRFKAFHDGGNLYLFIAADEPESAKMVAEPYGRDSNLLWRNDSVEITLTPDVKALSAYKFIVDSRGTFALVGDENRIACLIIYRRLQRLQPQKGRFLMRQSTKLYLQIAIPGIY